MERLTYWCDNGHGGGKWFVAIDAEGGEDYGPHVDRLAAYEEAGLEPEDFKRAFSEDTILKLAGQALGITPDRLRELAQADREGRCVVLPESYYTAQAAARKASGPAEQSERGQAAAWIMQRFGRMG